jgi:hypothetical protein
VQQETGTGSLPCATSDFVVDLEPIRTSIE